MAFTRDPLWSHYGQMYWNQYADDDFTLTDDRFDA